MTKEAMRQPLAAWNGGNGVVSPQTPTKDGRKTESPASIVTIPLSDASSTPAATLRSTIAMGDSGAEVTLDLSSLDLTNTSSSWNSPAKKPTTRPPMNALFDNESTPSPRRHRSSSFKRTPMAYPSSPILEQATPSPLFLTDSMCCSGAPKCWQDEILETTDESNARHNVQGKISSLLASPVSVDTWCNGWQAWSYVHSMDPPEEEEAFQQSADLKSTIQRVLRNRAFDVQARKRRLATLSKDLNPFQAESTTTPAVCNNKSLVKSQSFDITRHAPAIERASRSVVQPLMGLPSVWESVGGCGTMMIHDSPVLDRSSGSLLQDDGYDSDPEDFLRRPLGLVLDEAAHENVDPTDDVSAATRSSLLCPDDAVIVHELMNERLTLILHPTSDCNPPQAVSVWIEPGRRQNNELISPKFVYMSINNKSQGKISHQRSAVSSVDILDIHRILKVETHPNRSRHPFCKTRHTFLIKTIHDCTLMLETSSAAERDRLVRSFKLLVSRLGSMLVVKDDAVLEEFFIGVAPSPHFLN